ncbi:transposase [Chryseobacterium oryctis]|uniref:Transposase n=1 Tax=Chryseobacterium oryctis TaxID=2952618 RepID=A0ABT3HSK2_9FLAO|nr:transposase [Chryseobacterium oryctis]MCW3162761.1 transposase [Chryseobacterium oryctis]
MDNFKEINIGSLIQKRVDELDIDIIRICNFMKCNEEEIEKMYLAKTIDGDTLLKWSKLLEYDFFRIYSQHIILYAPQKGHNNRAIDAHSTLPKFRKNIYTKEIIEFLLDKIKKKEKTKLEIIEEYGIPKTTLYKWINKYSSN